ncbi:hypothetical protein N7474_005379 [Penicillium riverlandense]|uniref:uncharacterized protein n=1 Tax=Penicillium riverlandense TaxID=1903569 RepID=UPI0025485E9D|nr:uncharacterized protein N7474_005379 [Penicillium riverlandense]KAJ5819788.1 hypothetical protein N7474_005379 [Penicillium riverlandense]
MDSNKDLFIDNPCTDYEYDVQGDQHRHLSHLVGWYPGWSISSYQNGYTNETIQRAVNISLTDRGPGISDSNAGWEKVWRSACWARLNDTEKAYYELRLAIDMNIGQSGLDLYASGDPPTEPFQIDANFGYLGAEGGGGGGVLSMLAVYFPGGYEGSGSGDGKKRVVVLGPAIPAAWKGGRVRGLRLRGGGSVDFSWDDKGIVNTGKSDVEWLEQQLIGPSQLHQPS